MKLDPTVMRTMNSQDFRVMEAVEQGMKNHALVPLPLICSIANLRHGGTHKIVANLLRDKLLSHENKRQSQVDGYRITNAGYDILALNNLKQRGIIAALGQRIGTGKESDIYLAAAPIQQKGGDEEGGGHQQQMVLKFHRLGRTSFRNVRKKRDYYLSLTQQQQAHSWLFLSRLSALKEFAFLKALHEVDYPTPAPLAHNRHVVAMSLVRGMPLYQIYPKQISQAQAQDVYRQALELATRLAKHGLVHCDLNEFNLLVDLSGGIQNSELVQDDPYVRHSGQSVAGEKSLGALSKPSWWEQQHQKRQQQQQQQLQREDEQTGEPAIKPLAYLPNGDPKPVVTLIDFPQMISTNHPNAKELYQRDLNCLKRFFEKKLNCVPEEEDDEGEESKLDTSWESIVGTTAAEKASSSSLDAQVRASGYDAAAMQSLNRDLELYYFEAGPRPIASAIVEAADDDGSGDDESGRDLDGEESESGDESNNDEGQCDDSLEPHGTDTPQLHDSSSDDELESKEVSKQGDTATDMLLLGDEINRIKLEERAKVVVQKQLETQKRKSRRKGAFRKQNNNKTFVKGKRVYSEAY